MIGDYTTLSRGSRFHFSGRLRITVRDIETGKIKKLEFKNLEVNDGLKLILDKFGEDVSGTPKTGPSYIWIGSGDTSESNTDTDLDTYEAEKALTTYLRSAAEYTCTYSVTFGTADANNEWEEAGLANGAHGSGTLISRIVFTSSKFTKTNSQEVTVDWDITAARS